MNEQLQQLFSCWSFLFLIFTFLVISNCFALPTSIKTGFHTSSLVLTDKEFSLNITIFSGGSQVVAGEFNVSYPSEYVNLTKVEGGKDWTVIQKGHRYVFYTLTGAPDKTVVAILHFLLNETSVKREFNISLDYFKAADSNGKDLDVVIDPAVVSVTLEAGSEGAGGAAGISTRTWSYSGWILVAAIAIAATIIVLSLYLRTKSLPNYYLLDSQGRIVFTGKNDYIYGREDFIGLLPSNLLNYITRKSNGGQFRIFLYNNNYYIEDNHSKNPTLVDGVSIRGKGPVVLRDGSSISLPGVFYLVFRRTERK